MQSRTLAQVSAWMSMWLGSHSGHWSVIWTTIERPLGSGLQEPGLSPSCIQHKDVDELHSMEKEPVSGEGDAGA